MKKVAIIGAGISGLFFANLLRQDSNYEIIIYPRNNSKSKSSINRTIKLDDELIDISSSKIRQNIKLGISIRKYVPSKINELIKDKSYYL